MASDPNQQAPTKPQPITAKEFFEAVPPGTSCEIGNAARQESGVHSRSWYLNLPTLQLHCTTAECDGVRFFRSSVETRVEPEKLTHHFSTFSCRNCGKSLKTYAYRVRLSEDGQTAQLHKYGELPAFGPPTPARLITMLGAERDYYLKGRRSENQGLGIAAFAYYRRVLDNQRVRIIEEIRRVAERIGAEKAMLDDLDAAKTETQFSKAVEAVKHGIPQALLIDGHNPLLLLHTALSEGLHAQSDESCLELATSIRIVLTELVERMALALKDEAELKGAVSRLLASKGAAPDAGQK